MTATDHQPGPQCRHRGRRAVAPSNAPGVKPETCAARFLPLAGPSMCTTVRVSGSGSTFPKAPRACDAAPVAHCESCRPLAGAIYFSEQRPTRVRPVVSVAAPRGAFYSIGFHGLSCATKSELNPVTQ